MYRAFYQNIKYLALIFIVGCSSGQSVAPMTGSQNSESNYVDRNLENDFLNQDYSRKTSDDQPGISKILSLVDVLDRVVEENQKIKSYSSKGMSFVALVDQAEQIPNPEINLEAENVGGNLSGANSSELTAAISQLVEVGGKRTARSDLAKAEADAFRLQAKVEISEIIAEAKIAYNRVIFNQSLLDLAEQEISLAEEVVSTIKNKVSYGGILEVELTKAEIRLRSSRLKQARIKQDLEDSKRILAALWGGDEAGVGEISESMSIDDNPSETKYYDISNSPLFLLSKANILIAEKNHLREKTLAIPDLTVSAGYRRLNETEDNTFIGAVSIPFPIFNRNQGSIASAASQERAIKQEAEDFKVRLQSAVVTLQNKLRLLLSEKQALESTIIPDSEKSLKQAREAYALGRINYLDLFDSQKVFIESQERILEIMILAIETRVELQKIMGTVLTN